MTGTRTGDLLRTEAAFYQLSYEGEVFFVILFLLFLFTYPGRSSLGCRIVFWICASLCILDTPRLKSFAASQIVLLALGWVCSH